MFALRRRVSTMNPQEPLETSQASRNTSAESTARKSGSAINAPRSMLFNLIGKHIARFVALESTNVTVAPFSPGILYPNGRNSCLLDL